MKYRKVSSNFFIYCINRGYRPVEARILRIKGIKDIAIHRSTSEDGGFEDDWWNVSDGVTGYQIGHRQHSPRTASRIARKALLRRGASYVEEQRWKAINEGYLSPRYELEDE